MLPYYSRHLVCGQNVPLHAWVSSFSDYITYLFMRCPLLLFTPPHPSLFFFPSRCNFLLGPFVQAKPGPPCDMSPVPVKLIMTEICAGLAFFLPFSARHWEMEWGEGTERGEKGPAVGWEGMGVGGRPTLRGCTTWRTLWRKGRTRWRKRQRGPPPNAPHAFILYGSVPLESLGILSKHIKQMQDSACTHTHVHSHFQVCTFQALPACRQINHTHPGSGRKWERKHGRWMLIVKNKSVHELQTSSQQVIPTPPPNLAKPFIIPPTMPHTSKTCKAKPQSM